MVTEREQTTRSQPERICPACGIDRKTLAAACVSDSYQDRCAAWSITESCGRCREAMADVMAELQRRRWQRAHCQKCGAGWIEQTEDGDHCLACGFIRWKSPPLPYTHQAAGKIGSGR